MTYPPRRRWTFFDIDFGHREWSFLPTMMSRCWFVRNPNHYFCLVLQTKSNASFRCCDPPFAAPAGISCSSSIQSASFRFCDHPISFLCAPLPSNQLPLCSSSIQSASFVLLFHPISFLSWFDHAFCRYSIAYYF